MKEIWINLELHFKKYDFYNFRDFFRFNFDLNKIKMNKKGAKSARVPRGCDMARKATWQSHANPCNAYVALYTYIFIYLYYI